MAILKKMWLTVCLGLGLFLTTTGCQTTHAPSFTQSPTANIQDVKKDVKKAKEDLNKTTETIETNAQDGMNKTPETAKAILHPYFQNIIKAASEQKQIVNNLDQTTKKLNDAENKSVAFEAIHQKTVRALDDAKDSVTKGLREKYSTYSQWLFFIALVCGGISLFSGGNKLALYGGLVAGAGSAICIFIVQTVVLISWVVGIFAFVALALGAYTFWNKHKIIKETKQKTQVLETATRELVKTVEAAKPKMTNEGRKELFGDGPNKGDAFIIQSKETENIVEEIRKGIELAPPIPPTLATDVNGDGFIDENDFPPPPSLDPPKNPNDSKDE